MVKKVKRAENGMILDPVTVKDNTLVKEAFECHERIPDRGNPSRR